MGAAKKLELTPDEEFLQSALRDGRCIKTEFSMKALGKPDVGLQARVKHIDSNHCHRLSVAKQATGALAPVVIFQDIKTGAPYLADGHHRHAVYLNEKEVAIPAYLLKSDNAYEGALEFATMCNREMCLGRSVDDIKKAVAILLKTEKWWACADRFIASHVGTNHPLVKRARAQVSLATGKPMPVATKRRNGIIGFVQNSLSAESERRTGIDKGSRGRSIRYRTKYRCKTISSLDKHEVESEISDLKADLLARRASLKLDVVGQRLRAAGFVSVTGHNTYQFRGIKGFHRQNMVCLPCDFRDKESLAASVGDIALAKETISVICGQLIAAKTKTLSLRMIVLCYVEDGPFHVIDLYRRFGFEFMTPDELIDSLKINA